MADYQEGQTATGKKGEKYVFTGGAWHIAPGGAGPTLSKTDQAAITGLNSDAAKAAEIVAQYNQVKPVLKRFHPGPFRGALMDAAIPQEKGGIGNAITSTVIGAPLRALGVVSPQDVEDFQNIQRVKTQRVLDEQTRQKGVQTEGDAARIAQSTISPRKTLDANYATIAADTQRLNRTAGRAPFYSNWAHKYGGLQAPNEQGQSVEQAYQASLTGTTNAPDSPAWSLVKVHP